MSVYQDIVKFSDHSKVATVVTDENRRIEYVNKAFTRLCGHEIHEILGKNPGAILQGPGTSSETKIEIRTALQKRTPFDAKILNYHKDCHTYITGLYVVPFFDHFTGSNHFLALERELVSWDDDLLGAARFAKALADILGILMD